jgi:ring-1,2-phenylacetyl-CoA epoxidase subunit PaaE
MAFFNKIFKKENTNSKIPKGFYELEIKEIIHLTDEAIQLIFKIPSELKKEFSFIPGQYVNIIAQINNEECRRSYSICSDIEEDLSIAIKTIEGGKVSNWAKNSLQAGMMLLVSTPEGNFHVKKEKNIVGFVAGSGITPILSIAKHIEKNDGNLKLFYGNKTEKAIMFKSNLDGLKNTKTSYFLSQETKDNFQKGRLNKENISEIIKQDLSILKADGYFLCGPEEMIMAGTEVLKLFGVDKEKIHFELFTTPTTMKSLETEQVSFSGTSQVKIILDEEEINLTLKSDGKTILDAVSNAGYDAPYSCRGAVCCTCKAKIVKGKANMTLNYSLTDQEVADGYILTCQAHPASDELVITYDV